MKKALLVAAAAFALSSTVFAGRPTGLNLGGGYSADFLKGDFGTRSETATFVGPFVEVGYDLPFTNVLGLYVGARVNMGFDGKYQFSEDYQAAALTYVTNLSLPVQLALNVPVGSSSLFLDLGPTFDYWAAFRTVAATNSSIGSDIDSIDYLKDDNDVRRANIFLGGKLGVNIKNHVKVYAAYDQSLLNYVKNGDGKCGSSLFRIGACYVF